MIPEQIKTLQKLYDQWKEEKDYADFAKRASQILLEISKDLKYRDRCQTLSGHLDNLFGDWQEADKEFKLTTSSELRKELRERVDTKRDALRVAINQTIDFIQELSQKEKSATEEFHPDAVILTVLPQEYDAVCKYVANLQPAPLRNDLLNLYAWKTGMVPYRAGSYAVAVGMMGEAGNNKSALATIDAVMQRWSPQYIFFVGIAGGLEDEGVRKGDVVIADKIYGYEYGKLDEKFRPRDRIYFTHIGLLNGMNAHAADPNWKSLIQATPPVSCTVEAIQGEIASGDKVVDDPTNEIFAEVRKRWPKIKAVEMEAAGVGEAIAHIQSLGKTIHFMVVRGISDLPRPPQAGEEDKARGTQERDAWKNYAAHTAAAFTISYIASGLPSPPQG